MSHRVAVLSVLLSASVAFSIPSSAQGVGRRGDLVNNAPLGVNVNNNNDISSGHSMDTGSISGSVRTLDNHVVAEARVEVRDISSGSIVASGYTSPSGAFELTHLPRGAYEVIATSGISEAREQVQVAGVDCQVTLRLPHINADTGKANEPVSVGQLRVPEKARTEIKKAREAMAKSKPDEARKHVAKAFAIEPQYSDAFLTRGLIEFAENNLDAASEDFHQAVQCDASNSMAYVAMGALYNMKERYDDALRELDRGIALNPTSWQAHFEIAKSRLAKGDFQTAIAQAKQAEDLVAADFGPIHLVKGHALLGLKDYSAAIAEFETFLTKDAASPDADSVRQDIQNAKAFSATASK